ncbi:DUF3037 domain-containing protein [Daejeonella sp.]|uniref:DUF3037 domain-containing protein n=1 Tax=Daejeonella sp. TaxID=2805397 RepID=UPI00271F4D7D|nr:DUF3037 domain-containing protein [Daejeonella sp.]MDO8994910.1 DUF3037 domain-containing protein [Daejeonella sp.]MDP2414660.1 DUF3037 domain-containing protein [Daejeonella sp.]
MQEKYLFEYAVIRLVPRVEREEFLNVGLILYCSAQKFLQAKFWLDKERLKAFSPGTDLLEIEENLNAFCQISKGKKEAGPIAKLDQASRFRWLTATRSTVLQTSKVHPGFCEDAAETLERLFEEMVLIS